jgi:excisionase family DNA binding protein
MNEKIKTDREIELPEHPAIFSTSTAAQNTSFSTNFYAKNIRNGELPIIMIGREVRILREDLLEFLRKKASEGVCHG